MTLVAGGSQTLVKLPWGQSGNSGRYFWCNSLHGGCSVVLSCFACVKVEITITGKRTMIASENQSKYTGCCLKPSVDKFLFK